MWMLSGWWDRKSMMRQPSWMPVTGLGLRQWFQSTNLEPSLTEKTGMLFPAGIWDNCYGTQTSKELSHC